MKIYLKSYLKKNLGDDLFVKIITDRYPNVIFRGISLKKYDKGYGKNLKIDYGYRYKVVDKVLKKITKNNKSLERLYIKKCDKTVLIGGSMFIQYKQCNYPEIGELKNKDYYILGTNFGPYRTNEYLKSVEMFIKGARDVCFRDKNSYNIFKNYDNVRYEPDIVFSLDIKNVNIKNSKTVIVSVINCDKKSIREKRNIYEKKITETIKYFRKIGYNVVLMSFCKDEGDEIAIKRILNNCDDNDKKYIKTYYYNGDIREALNIISDSQIVVGTRFHANILGLLFGKTIIPIAYSKKTIDTLNDISFKGKILKIDQIDKFNPTSLTENDLNYKLDISEYKNKAELQFRELDKILKI